MDDFPASKICSSCEEDKPLEDFHRHKRGKWGRAERCKICKKQLDAGHYEKNSDTIKAREAKYRKENPEKVKISQHNKYMKRQAEIIANNKAWVKENREKVRGYKRRHQAQYEGLKKEKDLSPDYPTVIARDGMFCYLCGEEIVDGKYHVDHIIPITKGGYHAEFNLSVAHDTCNISKQNKLPEELPNEVRDRIFAQLQRLKALEIESL